MAPMVVLAFLSLTAGFLEPRIAPWLLNLGSATLAADESLRTHPTLVDQMTSALVCLVGIALAYLVFGRKTSARPSPGASGLHHLLEHGWEFDRLYDLILVRPFHALAGWSRGEVMNLLFQGPVVLVERLHRWLSAIQTGRIRWYAAVMFTGWLVLIAMAILL
jgi:NADH-quinone oxidoreductase subunit L